MLRATLRGMPTYVALLRGINVGGHRVIRMADLRGMFDKAGAKNVETYIQSGNVVFEHAARSAATLTHDLARTIAKAAGFDVSLVVRTGAELAATIEDNPFSGENADRLYVYFLAGKPTPRLLAPIDPEVFAPERCAAVRDVYLWLPTGMGRSKLAVALARLPGIKDATARNWRTVQKLAEMAS